MREVVYPTLGAESIAEFGLGLTGQCDQYKTCGYEDSHGMMGVAVSPILAANAVPELLESRLI